MCEYNALYISYFRMPDSKGLLWLFPNYHILTDTHEQPTVGKRLIRQ